jgi:hypothetical protein
VTVAYYRKVTKNTKHNSAPDSGKTPIKGT